MPEVPLSQPRVLILLACRNGERWLEEQLQSLLGQIGVTCQVLVSDDQSNDGSLDVVRSVARVDTRVTWIRRDRSSGSAAANFMRLFDDANTAGFTHVALSDQDDIWLPGKLQESCALLARNDAQLYSCATTAFWPDGRTALLTQSAAITRSDYMFEGAGQGCTFVMTTAFFARVQAFVRSYTSLVVGVHYHDWLIYALARSWHQRWVYDPDPRLRYRQHDGNDTGARATLSAKVRRFALIRTGWYLTQVRLMTTLCLLANPESGPAQEVDELLASESQTGFRRYRLALYLFWHSRRRITDRLVLCFCAVLGYFSPWTSLKSTP